MITVVGVPFDEFSSFMRGPAQAPPKIREAFHSDSANYFTERLIDLKDQDWWQDAGDMLLPTGVAAIREIEVQASRILQGCEQLLSLGGDHSIAFPLVKAVAGKYGKLNILHLDAHGDLYDEFDGNKYSHACPFARIMEAGLAKRLVQVGVRTLNRHQQEQADRFGVEIIEMKNWRADLSFEFDGPLYLSLDLDVLDPAFVPGVSHHEPGGLTTRELLRILQQVKGKVVAADLVEYNPVRDVNGVTAMVAAKLFKELLDLLHRNS